MQKLLKKTTLVFSVLLSFSVSLSACLKNKKAKQIEEEGDNYIWLEEVESKKALDFVSKESTQTKEEFAENKNFKESKARILKALDSKDKLLYVSRRGDYVYNFWRDAENIKGVWRRMLFSDYKLKKNKWEALINFDDFVKTEKKNWVFKGAECFLEDFNKCLVSLSNGGKDATEKREFDLKNKKFVKNGFFIPESKGSNAWIDKDTLLISTTVNKEEVTDSGYPSHVKVLRRGDKLENAKLVAKTDKKSLGIWSYRSESAKGEYYYFIEESFDFYTSSVSIFKKGEKPLKIEVPKTASFKALFKDMLFFEAKKDMTVDGLKVIKGSVFHKSFNKKNKSFSKATLFFSPSKEEAFKSLSFSKDFVILSTLKNVVSTVYFFDSKLNRLSKPLSLLNEFSGSFSVNDTSLENNEIIISTSDFLNPPKLKLVDLKLNETLVLQEEKAYFDSKDYKWEQKFATSDDGTKIPFFIVMHKSTKPDSKRPTIMYGYGGFQISLNPWYFKTQVSEWVEKDRVYVVANIRGGGEYGPSWHQAAQKFNKRKSYEDFASVAKELFKLKITSPKNLGIMGGSNGGLLVGASMVLYPKLYNAVFCAVPLLDMMRYHKLPPGASWMAEYGDPEVKEEREYILTYSPYQNIKEDTKYPEALFYTSTFDDRVQPGHARKMYAKMKDMGHRVHYYENSEGGHAGSADLKQRAFQSALSYSYFKSKIDNK